MKKILVIGDSHSFFWTGKEGWDNRSVFKGVDILHCGAATAHNLVNSESRMQSSTLIDNFLESRYGMYGCTIFCFGEIDCRAHVIYSASVNNISITEATKLTVDRYLSFISNFMQRHDLPVIIWGPSISSDSRYHMDSKLPAIGSNIERNFATYEFNRLIDEGIASLHAKSLVRHFTTINEQMGLDLQPVRNMFWDGLHLSKAAMPLARNLLISHLIEMGLKDMTVCLDFDWPVEQFGAASNLAQDKPIFTSSNYANSIIEQFPDADDGRPRFHTNLQPRPFVTIDLGYSAPIQRVEVYNSNHYPERLDEISIHFSDDSLEFTEVDRYRCENKADLAGAMCSDFSKLKIARFVRIVSETDGNYLHLSCVRVIGMSFMRTQN